VRGDAMCAASPSSTSLPRTTRPAASSHTGRADTFPTLDAGSPVLGAALAEEGAHERHEPIRHAWPVPELPAARRRLHRRLRRRAVDSGVPEQANAGRPRLRGLPEQQSRRVGRWLQHPPHVRIERDGPPGQRGIQRLPEVAAEAPAPADGGRALPAAAPDLCPASTLPRAPAP
jgi:hypothetical protein